MLGEETLPREGEPANITPQVGLFEQTRYQAPPTGLVLPRAARQAGKRAAGSGATEASASGRMRWRSTFLGSGSRLVGSSRQPNPAARA